MSDEVLRRRLLRLTYLTAVAAAAYLALRYLLGLVLPFLLAALVAEVTRRPVDALCARVKLPRRAVSFAVVTLTLLALLALAGGAVYALYAAAQDAMEQLPALMDSLQQGLQRLGRLAGSLPDSLAGALETAPATLVQTLTETLTSFLAGTAGRIPKVALTVTVSVIASYMVSADYHKLGVFLAQVVKPDTLARANAIRRVTFDKLRLLLRGYGILLLLTFAELTVGFLLLRLPRAPVLAALTALVDLLPVLGTGTVLIPWAAVLLLQGNTPLAAGLLALYAVVTALRRVVEPRVIGNQLRLSPLIVLACMFVGFRLFGLKGLLLAPVVASVCKELIQRDLL